MEANPSTATSGIPLPGGHLGLTWSTGPDVEPGELEALAESANVVESTVLPQPVDVLHRTFLPQQRPAAGEQGAPVGGQSAPVGGRSSSGPEQEAIGGGEPLVHSTLAGRSADGSLIAIGTVRVADDAGRRAAAIRAITAPSWRGRGIGRALLAWQDAVALRVLQDVPEEARVLGVPIAASMVDRRRLYTAAGFSAATRIEIVRRQLGDSPQQNGPGGPARVSAETDAAPDWPIRSIVPEDRDAVVGLLAASGDPHGFLMHSLTHSELVAVADPALSRVVHHDGELRGAVLAVSVGGSRPRSVLILGLVLDSPDPLVRQGVLADAARHLWVAGYREVLLTLTPTLARDWARPLTSQSFRGVASDPLYTIELH